MIDSAATIALIDAPPADAHAAAANAAAITAEQATNADTQEIEVASIRVDPAFNPRKRFDDADIAEFAERIHTSGWLSPPLVRPDPYGEGFLLVAGERRLRAIKHLGWTTVQVTVKSMNDTEHRKLALVENLDRRELNVAEEALAARDHLAAYEGDHDAAARALGWPVARLRHRLKLLHASPAVIDALLNGRIQLGHAELLATLPESNQDKALPRVISDGLTVAALREQINGFATPLSSAIFDTSACANCLFNTSCQGTLFEARVAEGNCTNKPCFTQKTEEALEAKRESMKADFGVVVLVSERAPEQSVPLVKSGPRGVGAAQFDACRTCEFRGAAIHDAPGPRLGTVESPLCFNTSCHGNMVKAYQQQLAEAEESQAAADAPEGAAAPTSTTKPAASQAAAKGKVKTAKATKATPKAQSVLRSVAEQYGAIVARAGTEAIGRSPVPALALAVYALSKLGGVEAKISAGDLREGLGLPDTVGNFTNATVTLAALAACDEAALNKAIQGISARLLTHEVNDRPFGGQLQRRALLPNLIAATGVNVADHVVVDTGFLNAHTKPAIEAVLEESGFAAWMASREDGPKQYRAMLAGKKEDLIAAVLSSGFSFAGYVPSGLDSQVAAWRKAEGMPHVPLATPTTDEAAQGEAQTDDSQAGQEQAEAA